MSTEYLRNYVVFSFPAVVNEWPTTQDTLPNSDRGSAGPASAYGSPNKIIAGSTYTCRMIQQYMDICILPVASVECMYRFQVAIKYSALSLY